MPGRVGSLPLAAPALPRERYGSRMLRVGVALIVAAVVLFVFGIARPATTWLLWAGVAIAAAAIVLIILDRTRPRS